MRAATRACTVALAVLLVTAPAFGQSTLNSQARRDTLFAWDDGEVDDSVYGRAGTAVGVMFIAHPPTTYVTEIHVYTEYDCCMYPDQPYIPLREFLVRVWTPSLGYPPVPWRPVGRGAYSGEEYPEQAWVSLVLPQPVRIDSDLYYPDRVFFAVVEWEHTCSPFIGIDDDGPQPGMSRRRLGPSMAWDDYPGNLMIRAVGTDSLGTPVDLVSWGTVKTRYR